jgi:RNA polymerase sigma-70 factor (ECF subfamily)
MQDSPSPSNVFSALSAVATERVCQPSVAELEVIELFDQFRERLFRYVLTFGLSVQDCEEVIQETFLALFQHLKRGKSRRNLRGWLFRVAHNLALKTRLRSRRDGQASAYEQLPLDGIMDPSPNPEHQLESAQTRRRLLAAFQVLPEQDRRCLSLRAEGLRYREIAGVLDISLGSVAVSLGRSLTRLTRVSER